MKIAIIGLGLIGGSFAKALKTYTTHEICGYDRNCATMDAAVEEKAIDHIIYPSALDTADITIVALLPEITIQFINEHVQYLRPGSIVMDICGVKQYVVEHCRPILEKHNIRYVPTHPMAGREYSGFSYSRADLFSNASMIITPLPLSGTEAIDTVTQLSMDIGFKKVVQATPEIHDEIIAFTSQLAHLVSNAYIKSPTAQKESGFSAGSFLDLTRVSKLDENMWTSLFMINQKPLLIELNRIIASLQEYQKALAELNTEHMRTLLREGRILKEKSLVVGAVNTLAIKEQKA